MSDPNPYHRLHPPPPSLTSGIPPSIAPSPPGLSPQIGPFYARFQPILGTQKCFPRDFRDQFHKIPRLARGIFFKKCVANFSGGKGPFLPGGRGGWGVVSFRGRGLGLCPVWVGLCPVSITTGEDGRRLARAGSLQADTTGEDYRPGPASDLARVGWLYRGFSAL